jgi:putative sterol carrier protein
MTDTAGNAELITLINGTIDRFNKRVSEDEDLRKELEGLTKRVQVELSDGGTYNFILNEKHIDPVGSGPITEPDIRILSDTATLSGVLKKEIKPMKAWATRKIQIKGSFSDLMKFRKFF